jgi:hypothetical protein
MSEKQDRLNKANELIALIAGCGRKFFAHNGRISHFEIDQRGRIWFIDAYREARIYTHFISGRWHGFSEGGTLRDLVIRLRDFISIGKKITGVFGPFPDWYSEGDPWGYGQDMQKVAEKALELAISEKSEDR